MKNNKIIIYDFDGTLTKYPIPRFEILAKCGLKDNDINAFYAKVKLKATTKQIDLYKALFETYFETIKDAGYKVNDENLCLGANNVSYNKGVLEYLENIEKSNIKNYLLSSGLKVFLDRVDIAKHFKKIYATTFTYDANNEVNGIDYLMSDKNKVEAIKEIMHDNNLNDCTNIIYIGDGLTDIYAMEYVKKNNGITIFVYNEENKDINILKEKDIVTLFTKADFSLNSELYKYIKETNSNIDK